MCSDRIPKLRKSRLAFAELAALTERETVLRFFSSKVVAIIVEDQVVEYIVCHDRRCSINISSPFLASIKKRLTFTTDTHHLLQGIHTFVREYYDGEVWHCIDVG